jgi:hypothetical protein
MHDHTSVCPMSAEIGPDWFPFSRSDAESAFQWLWPEGDVREAVANLFDGPAVSGVVTPSVLLLLALESEAAASQVLRLRPDLADLVDWARQSPNEFRRFMQISMTADANDDESA